MENWENHRKLSVSRCIEASDVQDSFVSMLKCCKSVIWRYTNRLTTKRGGKQQVERNDNMLKKINNVLSISLDKTCYLEYKRLWGINIINCKRPHLSKNFPIECLRIKHEVSYESLIRSCCSTFLYTNKGYKLFWLIKIKLKMEKDYPSAFWRIILS